MPVTKRMSEKKAKKHRSETAAGPFSLLAEESAINPALSSLFAPKPTPQVVVRDLKPRGASKGVSISEADPEDGESRRSSKQHEREAINGDGSLSSTSSPEPEDRNKRKRKRKERDDEVEDLYMRRLAREEAKEADSLAKSNAPKRQKTSSAPINAEDKDEIDGVAVKIVDDDELQTAAKARDKEAPQSPPPRHETEQAADDELAKANRTVFLGNVSTAAISSKNARKTLINHLKSFFQSVAQTKEGEPKHNLESIRFRSTPYSNSIPKKAAFATKQLMDATTKSTNAYAVYSSQSLAREAAKHLNASVVLSRHLRVDSVAHPSKVDNKRCVFVGNLGFVDDESNIQAANEEEGKETRKPGKHPADVEEGLWSTFGKCGTVESVRVIRDSTTRVGKGIAYVQFDDANAVESALLYDGKKFPPMLPRKLRVARAKAQKKNAKSGASRPSTRPNASGYQRKITGEEASMVGRASKLFGRASATQMKNDFKGVRRPAGGIQTPEKFVFEGHRASSKSGKSGLKLGGRGKNKPGKPTNRSAKRGAAFKSKAKA